MMWRMTRLAEPSIASILMARLLGTVRLLVPDATEGGSNRADNTVWKLDKQLRWKVKKCFSLINGKKYDTRYLCLALYTCI